ncbi:hypothetical protein TELCIR_25613, partial [Teladorsagia circumcincta]
AGIFVTSVVTATIILVRPFKIDIFATIRDLIFYLIALGWILFVFLYSNQVYIWEPSGELPPIAFRGVLSLTALFILGDTRCAKKGSRNVVDSIVSNVRVHLAVGAPIPQQTDTRIRAAIQRE